MTTDYNQPLLLHRDWRGPSQSPDGLHPSSLPQTIESLSLAMATTNLECSMWWPLLIIYHFVKISLDTFSSSHSFFSLITLINCLNKAEWGTTLPSTRALCLSAAAPWKHDTRNLPFFWTCNATSISMLQHFIALHLTKHMTSFLYQDTSINLHCLRSLKNKP